MIALPATFRRDGLRLAVSDRGGTGLPVVFQHGLCGDARQTAEVFPPHPRFRRITLECRGHGGSEPGDPRGFGIATFAEDLAGFLEEQDLWPVVIGGISMGAAVSLRLAVRRPDLVRGLILARPAWITDAAPENMAPNAEVGHRLRTLPPPEARDVFAASATAHRLAREAPYNLASLMGFFERQPLEVTAALLTRISTDGPGIGPAELRRLSIPTLVIGHDRDVVHPFAHAKELAALIPGARLARIASKAEDRSQHVAGFRAALATFLEDLL